MKNFTKMAINIEVMKLFYKYTKDRVFAEYMAWFIAYDFFMNEDDSRVYYKKQYIAPLEVILEVIEKELFSGSEWQNDCDCWKLSDYSKERYKQRSAWEDIWKFSLIDWSEEINYRLDGNHSFDGYPQEIEDCITGYRYWNCVKSFSLSVFEEWDNESYSWPEEIIEYDPDEQSQLLTELYWDKVSRDESPR